MRNKLWIIVGVLAGLMLAGYLLALLSTSKSNTSSAIETSGQRERSWLGDMIHAWKVTRPKDDGIRRVKSIYPDADTSECVGVTKTSDQIITTHFAGHILQYPCTANHDGRSTIHYDQNDEVIYQNHALYLSVLVGSDKETIWRRSFDEQSDGKNGFKVKLSSDGEKLSHEPIKTWIENATKVADFESLNLSVYLTGNDIKGFILNAMNEEGGYPSLGCTGLTAERALDIFDPARPPFERAVCRGTWKLNEYIRVVVLMFDSNLARDFEFFYRKVDQGLREIILSEPGEIQTSM